MYYDNKITIIDIPASLLYFTERYNIINNALEIGRLLEDVMSLSEKLLYATETGVTKEDLAELVNTTPLVIIGEIMLNDFIKMVTSCIYELLGTLVLHDLTGTVKYVVDLNDYKFILETYRMWGKHGKY